MFDFVNKERAMDCVYEAATAAEMKKNEIADLLYRIRAKIANEPSTALLLSQALRALVDTESDAPCVFCKQASNDCYGLPSETCWLNYLKLMERAENE